MKVKHLLERISNLKTDDDICVLFWTKEDYDYDPDDEVTLTNEAWTETCTEFDEWTSAGLFPGEWIADAVSEKASSNLVTR